MKDKKKPEKAKQMTNASGYGSNYACFKWSNGAWTLTQNSCDYGCDPVPPEGPGAYEGQVVCTPCACKV